MHSSFTAGDSPADRRVSALCRSLEAADVRQQIRAFLSDEAEAEALWLFWARWRAVGREALSRETELSPWEVADRLRRLRKAGVPVLSWSVERDLIARGRFFQG